MISYLCISRSGIVEGEYNAGERDAKDEDKRATERRLHCFLIKEH